MMKNILQIALTFICISKVFCYNHEEFKQDSLRLLDLEMQEQAGVEVDFWAAQQQICQFWYTTPEQELNKIIKDNEQKVFDFLQKTLTFKQEEDAQEDLWDLFMQAIPKPENVDSITAEWIKQKIEKPTAYSQEFAYSHRDQALKLDNQVIDELAKLFAGLEQSQKDLFKAVILKNKKDLYFDRIEEADITTLLFQSQRRADMVDAMSDRQCAYLIFNFCLKDAPSVADYVVASMREAL